MTPDALLLGAGKHGFEPALLERYRDAVVDPVRGASLVAAVEQVEAAGHEVGGRRYKRQPAGYTADGRRADLLLHECLYAYSELSPVPVETHTPDLPALCAGRFAEMAPVQDWLVAL